MNCLTHPDAVQTNSDRIRAISVVDTETIAFLCFILAFCDDADHHSWARPTAARDRLVTQN
jgi:hypothetical protein